MNAYQHAHAHTYTPTHIFKHTRTHLHAYTHIQAHTHTHTQSVASTRQTRTHGIAALVELGPTVVCRHSVFFSFVAMTTRMYA